MSQKQKKKPKGQSAQEKNNPPITAPPYFNYNEQSQQQTGPPLQQPQSSINVSGHGEPQNMPPGPGLQNGNESPQQNKGGGPSRPPSSPGHQPAMPPHHHQQQQPHHRPHGSGDNSNKEKAVNSPPPGINGPQQGPTPLPQSHPMMPPHHQPHGPYGSESPNSHHQHNNVMGQPPPQPPTHGGHEMPKEDMYGGGHMMQQHQQPYPRYHDPNVMMGGQDPYGHYRPQPNMGGGKPSRIPPPPSPHQPQQQQQRYMGGPAPPPPGGPPMPPNGNTGAAGGLQQPPPPQQQQQQQQGPTPTLNSLLQSHPPPPSQQQHRYPPNAYEQQPPHSQGPPPPGQSPYGPPPPPQSGWVPPPRPYSPQMGGSQQSTYRPATQPPHQSPASASGSGGGPPLPPQSTGPAAGQYSAYPQRYPTPPGPPTNHRSPYPPPMQYSEAARGWTAGPGSGHSPAPSPGPAGHPPPSPQLHPPQSPGQQHSAPSPSPQPAQSPHQEATGQNSNDSSSGVGTGLGTTPGTPNSQAMRPTPSPTGSSGSRSMSPAVGQSNVQMPPRPSSSHSMIANQTSSNPGTPNPVQQQYHHQQPQQPPPGSESPSSGGRPPPPQGGQQPPPGPLSAGQGSYQTPQQPHMPHGGYKMGPNGPPPPPQSMSPYPGQQAQYQQGGNYSPRPQYPGGYGPPPGQQQPPPPNMAPGGGHYNSNRPMQQQQGPMPPHSYPPYQQQQQQQGPPQQSWVAPQNPASNHMAGGPGGKPQPAPQGQQPSGVGGQSPHQPNSGSPVQQGPTQPGGGPPPLNAQQRPLNYLKHHLQHKVGAPPPGQHQQQPGYGNGPGMHPPMGPPHHMGPPPPNGPTNMGPPNTPQGGVGVVAPSFGATGHTHSEQQGGTMSMETVGSGGPQDNGLTSSGSNSGSGGGHGNHPVTSLVTTGPDGPLIDEASQQSTLSNASAASADDPQCSTPKSRKSDPSAYNQSGSHLGTVTSSPGPGGPHSSGGQAHEDFEMGSPTSWNRTPASPKSDSLCKLYEMDENPDRRGWLDKLLSYMDEKRTPITACPTISKQPLDLFRLYMLVKDRGGYAEVCKVTKSKTWKDIAGLLGIGASSSAAYTLRKHYSKFILAFECQYDRGGVDPSLVMQQAEVGSKKKAVKNTSVPSPVSVAGSSNSQDSFPPPGSSNTSMDGYNSYSNYPANATPDFSGPPNLQRPASQTNSQSPHPGMPYPNQQANYSQYGSEQYPPPGGHQAQFPPPNRTMYSPYGPEAENGSSPSNANDPYRGGYGATPGAYPQARPYPPQQQPGGPGPVANSNPPPTNQNSMPQPPVGYSGPPPQQDYYRADQNAQPRRHPDFEKQSQSYSPYSPRPALYGWQNNGQYRGQYPPPQGPQPWQQGGQRPPGSVPNAGGPPSQNWDRYPGQNQPGPYPGSPQGQPHWGGMGGHGGSAGPGVGGPGAMPPSMRPQQHPQQRPKPMQQQLMPNQASGKPIMPSGNGGPFMGQGSGLPTKRDIVFPMESIEATMPIFYRRKKMSKNDISPVDPWRIFMALRSGLLIESTWALDVINILLFDDSSVQYFGLAHLPGLLNLLLDHFQKSLADMFDPDDVDTRRNDYGWAAATIKHSTKSILQSSKDGDTTISKNKKADHTADDDNNNNNNNHNSNNESGDDNSIEAENEKKPAIALTRNRKGACNGRQNSRGTINSSSSSTVGGSNNRTNSRSKSQDNGDAVDLGTVTDLPDPTKRVLVLTSTTNYTLTTRKGVPVKINNAASEEDLFVLDAKRNWDVDADQRRQLLTTSGGGDPWTAGHIEPFPHDYLMGSFRAEIVHIPFARFIKGKNSGSSKVSESESSEMNDSRKDSDTTNKENSANSSVDKNVVSEKESRIGSRKRTRGCSPKGMKPPAVEVKKESVTDQPHNEIPRMNGPVAAVEVEAIADIKTEVVDPKAPPQTAENGDDETEQEMDIDDEERENDEDDKNLFNITTTVRDPALVLKRRRMSDYEDECYTRDEASLYLVNESQDSLARRCVGISNILRNLTFVPGNEIEFANSSTFLAILGKLLLINHQHPVRQQKTRNYDREEDTDCTDSCSSLACEPEWWWDYLVQIRENMLVAAANISGYMELSRYDEIITRPVLDGLLHWAVCPSAHGQDPFPSCGPHSLLSPQRLALEALCKLCVTDANVDLVIATPPFSRLEKLCAVLTRHLCRNEEQVLREFSVNLLHYMVAADSSMARTVALQSPCISYLVAFIEQAEQTALGVANQSGINYLRENPDSMGTSLDMLRRAAGTLLHLARHPDNRPLFMQQEQRLLALVMSHILDQQVALIISRVLFQMSRGQGPVLSSIDCIGSGGRKSKAVAAMSANTTNSQMKLTNEKSAIVTAATGTIKAETSETDGQGQCAETTSASVVEKCNNNSNSGTTSSGNSNSSSMNKASEKDATGATMESGTASDDGGNSNVNNVDKILPSIAEGVDKAATPKPLVNSVGAEDSEHRTAKRGEENSDLVLNSNATATTAATTPPQGGGNSKVCQQQSSGNNSSTTTNTGGSGAAINNNNKLSPVVSSPAAAGNGAANTTATTTTTAAAAATTGTAAAAQTASSGSQILTSSSIVSISS